MMRKETDVVVIGSGFGGLGTALSLAERGFRVELFERLKYPGGCASTFTKNGYRFEAGATLSSGFGEGQLFQRWVERYKVPIQLEWLSTTLHFRAPNLSLDIPDQRDAFIDLLCRLPDAPQAGLRRFFAHQKEVANTLWGLFTDLDLLPPWTLSSMTSHLRNISKYAPLLPDLGRTLTHVMKRYGVHQFQPLKLYLDALCQITVQCAADEVESPFALAAMDYYFRGTAHIQGGLGQLAEGLCEAIDGHGGGLHMSAGVKRLEPLPSGGWRVHTRRGVIEAPVVVANVLPQAIRALLPQDTPLPKWLDRQQRDLERGWGAAMLYLVAKAPHEGGAEHWQMIGDATRPLREGNHVFCSISGETETDRAPMGARTMTLSTHIPMKSYLSLSEEERGVYISGIQKEMRNTFSRRSAAWSDHVFFGMPASPRTFERFTHRPQGYVGGAPKFRGLHHYLSLGPRPIAPGLFLTGDSQFPGQSTLAAASGGTRVAAYIERRWSTFTRKERSLMFQPQRETS